MTVLLDAFALIALLGDEPAAGDVEALLRGGEAAVTAVNLAEALDVLQRGEGISRSRLDELIAPLISDRIRLIAIEYQIAAAAADIRARHYHRVRAPLSLADCLLLAAAGHGDTVATADEPLITAAEAEGIEVKRLPR